jgi:hypothetical protein
VRFERENAEERPPSSAFQQQKWWTNSNENGQENGSCKQKYLSLIWK